MSPIASRGMVNPTRLMTRALVEHTPENLTPFLRTPGVALIARSHAHLETMQEFLHGFDPELGFQDYLDHGWLSVPDGIMLCKAAGQLCYMSMGPSMTPHLKSNEYIQNIKKQRHGSVLEHASFTFLIFGISRSLTHELVRHRAGMAFSQVSQRYVDGKVLRFVMRPEFQGQYELEQQFFNRIDRAAQEYESLARALTPKAAGPTTHEERRNQRKAVNQTARCLLPNETEAPIIVTGNARSWRHVLEMRCSQFAEPEIRRAMFLVWEALLEIEPALFDDYSKVQLADGTTALKTEMGKI